MKLQCSSFLFDIHTQYSKTTCGITVSAIILPVCKTSFTCEVVVVQFVLISYEIACFSSKLGEMFCELSQYPQLSPSSSSTNMSSILHTSATFYLLALLPLLTLNVIQFQKVCGPTQTDKRRAELVWQLMRGFTETISKSRTYSLGPFTARASTSIALILLIC